MMIDVLKYIINDIKENNKTIVDGNKLENIEKKYFSDKDNTLIKNNKNNT